MTLVLRAAASAGRPALTNGCHLALDGFARDSSGVGLLSVGGLVDLVVEALEHAAQMEGGLSEGAARKILGEKILLTSGPNHPVYLGYI